MKVWHIGVFAGLFATLLMIPIRAEANPSDEVAASVAEPSSVFPSTPAPMPAMPVVKMNDDDPMYQPSSVHIIAGQTVEWENDGQVSHSVTDDPAQADNPVDALLPKGVQPFSSGNVMPGGMFRHTFTNPGRYRYFCLTHEMDKMVGEVIVDTAEPTQSTRRTHQPPRTIRDATAPAEQTESSAR